MKPGIEDGSIILETDEEAKTASAAILGFDYSVGSRTLGAMLATQEIPLELDSADSFKVVRALERAVKQVQSSSTMLESYSEQLAEIS